jgi:hypothetical protein
MIVLQVVAPHAAHRERFYGANVYSEPMTLPDLRATALGLVITGVGFIWFFGAQANAGDPPNQSAMIGRPFQISKSVMEFCEARPQPMMCEQAMPLLAAMRSEKRDPHWAAPLEALIATSMRVGGKDWVQIRALECRSTHCALEYAVYVDDLNHDVDGDKELERRMEPVGGIVAPELKPGSNRGSMVSVLIWTKRS